MEQSCAELEQLNMAAIPIFNPTVPFVGQIPGGFRPSLMVRIRGRISGYGGRCTIDFLNSPTLGTEQDIMFHISIRPKEKAIVRNHYQNGYWAMEERYGPCLVRKHETFEIVILAEMQHYKLAVNGHHLGVFRHRMPLHLVQYLHISGEVEIDHILLEQDMRSAQEHMIVSQVAMPYNVVTVMPNQPPIHHHYTPPPPPYFSQSQQPPNSSITRIGIISIERRPRSVIVHHNFKRNMFRF